MMTNPPIDKLIKKASCRYELVAAVTQRAKQLLKQNPEAAKSAGYKALSIAAEEIYNGSVVIGNDEDVTFKNSQN